ncbi:hypothetical protein BDF19DRAFT_78976 [Syncephalis fuscata]|nr:hypothetical protein BDF19DRAFT_78976 [Syncephalis fuscata]
MVNAASAAVRQQQSTTTTSSTTFASVNQDSQSTRLLKVETLANLKAESINTAENEPQCRIIASNEAIGCIVGTQVHLFNADCTVHEAAITLDCRPELAAFSNDARFLVVADQLGSIHFIHRLSRSVVYSQAVEDVTVHKCDSTFSALVFGCSKGYYDDENNTNNDTLESLFIVYNKTHMLCLENVDFKQLDVAIQAQNSPDIQKIKGNITTISIDLSTQHNNVYDVIQYKSNFIVTGNGQSVVSVWDCLSNTSTTPNIPVLRNAIGTEKYLTGAQRVLMSPSGHHLILLDNKGRLSVFHFPTLIQLGSFEDYVFDNISFTGLYPQDHYPFTILAITKQDTQRYICIVDVPGFTIKQQLTVAHHCWLAEQAFSRRNDIMFIELDQSQSIKSLVPSLHIRSLSETVPISRFQQLLRKRKYDDAKQWAQLHQLDVNMIVQYRLEHYVSNDNNNSSNSIHTSIVIKANEAQLILSDLNSLQDISYGITFCIHAHTETVEMTQQLLEWAQSKCSILIETNKHRLSKDINILIEQLHNTLNRWGTWQYIRPFTSNSNQVEGEKETFSSTQWHQFRSSNLAKQLGHCFKQDQIEMASIIWRRHHQEFHSIADKVVDCLNEMSDNTLLSGRLWLQDQVLPWLIQNTNNILSLYQWLEKRARRIELYDGRPHRALDVMRLTATTRFDENHSCQGQLLNLTPHHYVQQVTHTSFPLILDVHTENKDKLKGINRSDKSISLFYHQLLDRYYLWTELNIQLTPNDYNQKTPLEIGLLLLTRVQWADSLIEAIEQQLIPYAKKHQLCASTILCDYMMN